MLALKLSMGSGLLVGFGVRSFGGLDVVYGVLKGWLPKILKAGGPSYPTIGKREHKAMLNEGWKAQTSTRSRNAVMFVCPKAVSSWVSASKPQNSKPSHSYPLAA